ncbi:hypothetical protein LTR84_000186 [Exophiala bonariae]|uniref:NmrA-like domain-containing protein n=1 Tax=Exophiala bonariae TaxID=1690606 RepID=A0AAV9NTW0_9EURO|nr:hypothetical protein LTR84_000186 [Exophiala bonariae]
MPYFQPKRDFIEWLKQQARSISWTAIISGPFFDQALKNTFHGYQPPNEFYLLDEGDTPYGTTNLHTIGHALFKILSDPKHFGDSANRYINIHSHMTTQQEVLAALEKASGQPFKIHRLSSDTFYDNSLRRFHNVKPGEPKILLAERDIIQCITYGKGKFKGLGDPRDENDWTEKLGLPAEDLLDDVKAVLDGIRPERDWNPRE